MAFRQIKAPALANQAVIETKLDVSSVSGQTAAASVASLANDTLLMHDGSLNALRKLSVANLVNSLSTSNLAEGSNLYFTDARAQAAVAQDIADAVAAEAALRSAADTTLQANIDAEEAARIAADNTLTTNLANEVTRATGREDAIEAAYIAADSNLQSQINNILSNTDPAALDSLTEIVTAYQAADDVFTAGIATNANAIQAETDRAQAAELVLQGNIDTVLAEVDLIEGTIGGAVSATGAWVGYTGTNYIDGATSLTNADVLLDAQIKAMDTAYKAADLIHSNDILSLEGRMDTAETDIINLENNLAAEILRATTAEAANAQAITDEINARVIAVQGAKDYADAQDALLIGDATVDGTAGNTITDRIATAVSDLQAYADQAELDAVATANAYSDAQDVIQTAALQAYADTAEADAITSANAYTDAREVVLQGNIDTEEAARIAGDSDLQTQINNILNNTDPAAIDSFTEVVAAFEAADSTLSGLIAANTSAINAEVTRATNAEATLQTAIDTEATTRASADTVLQTNINTVESNYIAADTAINTEITATQASLGTAVAVDGTFAGYTGTSYIDAATSMTDADYKLDAAIQANADQIAANQTAISTNLSSLQGQITTNDGDILALQTDLLAEVSRASGAEATLQTNIDNVQAELDVTQVGAGLDATGSYVANTGTNYIAAATSLFDADVKLDAQVKTNADAIATETQARIDAVNAEAATRATNDSALQTAINNEVTRATNAETALDGRVTQNETDISALQSAATAEQTARINGDTALQTEIDTTQTSIGTAVSATGTWVGYTGTNYIDAATSLTNADVLLDTAIKTTDARVDALLQGTTTDFDTFVEVVTAFQNADTNLNQAITDLAAAASTARDAIQAELDVTQAGAGLALDGTYVADLTKTYIDDATSLFNADQQLDDAIVAEVAARIAADGVIDTFIGTGTVLDTTATDLAGAINELKAQVESGNLTATDARVDALIATSGAADANGAFIAYSGTNYIDAATSMKSADVLLDAALKAEETARISAINAEASARSSEDASIRVDFGAADTVLQQNIDAVEVGAGLETNGSYLANGAANYIDTATSLKVADNLLDAALKTEELARIAGDNTLQGNIDAEAATRLSADNTLQANIDAEATTRANADSALDTRVTNLETEMTNTQTGAGLNTDGTYTANGAANYVSTAVSLKDADNKLDAAIKAEETARIAADNTLTVNLAAEVTRATNAETTNANNIQANADNLAQEILDRAAADANLQSQIDFIVSNTDGAALDSLTEIVAAFQAADSSTLATVNANTTAINDEITRATTAEGVLQANIDAEEARAIAAEAALQADIDTRVLRAGDTMTGVLNMGSNQIQGLADGTAATDAVNKGQLDAGLAAQHISVFTTDDLAEGSNLYYTDARSRLAISVDDVEGNGDFSYNNTTGVISADLSKAMLELTDVTDTDYVGKQEYVLRVNATETGMELVHASELQIFGATYRQVIDGDGVQTTYALNFLADETSTLVFVGGVIQDPTTHYTIDNVNQTITFTSAIPLGTQAVVVAREMVGAAPFVEPNTITTTELATNLKPYVQGSDVATTTGGDVVDTFDGTAYRSAKYIIQVDDGAGAFETREALVVHDGTTAYITEYAMVYTGAGLIGDASVQMNGTNVELVYTTTSGTATVKVISTYIDA